MMKLFITILFALVTFVHSFDPTTCIRYFSPYFLIGHDLKFNEEKTEFSLCTKNDSGSYATYNGVEYNKIETIEFNPSISTSEVEIIYSSTDESILPFHLKVVCDITEKFEDDFHTLYTPKLCPMVFSELVNSKIGIKASITMLGVLSLVLLFFGSYFFKFTLYTVSIIFYMIVSIKFYSDVVQNSMNILVYSILALVAFIGIITILIKCLKIAVTVAAGSLLFVLFRGLNISYKFLGDYEKYNVYLIIVVSYMVASLGVYLLYNKIDYIFAILTSLVGAYGTVYIASIFVRPKMAQSIDLFLKSPETVVKAPPSQNEELIIALCVIVIAWFSGLFSQFKMINLVKKKKIIENVSKQNAHPFLIPANIV